MNLTNKSKIWKYTIYIFLKL